MQLRPPTIADLPTVAAINNHYLGRATMQLSPVSAANFFLYLPGSDDGRHVLSVLETERGIEGFAMVRPYSSRGGYLLAGVSSVYLAPEALGKGYGKTLMDEIIRRAYSAGYRHLTAKILSENTGSIRFHERLGYRLVGVQQCIGCVAERRINVSLMELLLDLSS